MANQSFTGKQFSYLARQGDYRTYFNSSSGPNKTLKDELLAQAEINLKKIETFAYVPFTQVTIASKNIYSLPRITPDKSNLLSVLTSDFVLRKINQNLKRIYKVEQADRFSIIQHVKQLLTETTPFYVCKLDIKSFYENIDKKYILSNISNSAIVSYETRKLLTTLFINFDHESGLPRGINVSATLSEYYLKDFDKHIRTYPGVYFYGRFVDDIIIFSSKKIYLKNIKDFENALPKGLAFNVSKQSVYDLSVQDNTAHVKYLGYEFVVSKGSKSSRTVKTSISTNKLAKYKQKIIKSFLSFQKNEDFELLKNRLLFLSGTYPLKTQRKKLSRYESVGYLHGGILYSYPLIDDFSCLKSLDSFLKTILNSKNNARYCSKLTAIQISELKKFSFYQGFMRKISRNFGEDQIAKIVKCWN